MKTIFPKKTVSIKINLMNPKDIDDFELRKLEFEIINCNKDMIKLLVQSQIYQLKNGMDKNLVRKTKKEFMRYADVKYKYEKSLFNRAWELVRPDLLIYAEYRRSEMKGRVGVRGGICYLPR